MDSLHCYCCVIVALGTVRSSRSLRSCSRGCYGASSSRRVPTTNNLFNTPVDFIPNQSLRMLPEFMTPTDTGHPRRSSCCQHGGASLGCAIVTSWNATHGVSQPATSCSASDWWGSVTGIGIGFATNVLTSAAGWKLPT